ncbi:MAG: hypothetical protein ACLTZM_27260 [Ruminococcus sp.]
MPMLILLILHLHQMKLGKIVVELCILFNLMLKFIIPHSFKNSANFGGGAIESWKSNITMDLCNITDNNAEHGGAIVFYGERVGNHVTGTLNIYNSTIHNNKGILYWWERFMLWI